MTCNRIALMAAEFILLVILLAGVSSGVFGSESYDEHDQGSFSRRILTNVQSPAASRPCTHAFGPWPPVVPHGSVPFNDGAHTNISRLTINFADNYIRGVKVTYVDVAGNSGPTFKTFTHGTLRGRRKGQFHSLPGNPDNALFVQVGGFFDGSGLNALLLIDVNRNQYGWGKDAAKLIDTRDFLSPLHVGYLVGFFGAANHTAITQIGGCFSGA